MKQARTLMLNSIQKELETRLGDSQCQYSHLALSLIHISISPRNGSTKPEKV